MKNFTQNFYCNIYIHNLKINNSMLIIRKYKLCYSYLEDKLVINKQKNKNCSNQ